MLAEIFIVYLPSLYFKMICNTYLQWLKYAIIITIYASLVILIVGGACNPKEMTGIWKRATEMRKKDNGAV